MRAGLAATALLVAACTAAPAGPIATTTPTSLVSTTTEVTVPERMCEPVAVETEALASTDDLQEASIALSQAVFPTCADHVVVSGTASAALATGSQVAVAEGGPLLVLSSDDPARVRAEVERLRPRTVVTVGVTLDRFPETRMVSRPANRSPERHEPSGERLWMLARGAGDLGLVVAPAAAAGGGRIAQAPSDLRSIDGDERSAVVDGRVTFVGAFPDRATWQLDVVRRGLEVPGGGQLVLADRRMVALYGSPYSPALGVLGEQDAVASVDRARELAAAYEAEDGVTSIPAFDLIATVASAGAGEDGDYSAELSVDDIRPWIDAAAASGVYVVIDLQPGRTDFLTQAQRYEELLLLPHVGLALDPEWRLGPDQVHLRQIGTVSAAEINEVSGWLASLVREHALPQKLLIVHQFKLSMISDRQDVRTHPELAVVIQMDGQGPLASKYGTFDAITQGALDTGWLWGWKNFYDEDTPTATPAQTLSVDPQPVFISYQ